MKALVLKTSEVQASVGSNPTLSAIILQKALAQAEIFCYNILSGESPNGVVLKSAEEDGLLNR